MTAIRVPDFLDNEDEEYPEEGGPSLLKYVSELDVGTMGRVKAAAPWLKLNFSQTANQTYLANHCEACDELQAITSSLARTARSFPKTKLAWTS
ncbi:hypothetical protein ACWA5G_16315 [Xanthomonas axonopodis pv. ricini]|uniref:hypothetical protein n=1 Tax=Xanthomonas euvesicatoria TaxID=456327 RepID=UPI002455EF82|nr:hypothetical protein [Xanthomonas euvesicatoria]MDH4910079.1 hypothetical protein [Xanthomonas euvesicatoria]